METTQNCKKFWVEFCFWRDNSMESPTACSPAKQVNIILKKTNHQPFTVSGNGPMEHTANKETFIHENQTEISKRVKSLGYLN